jgi:hypothetical protein
MTMDDVKEWARAHGFRQTGGSSVVASYGDLLVSLTFLRHEVRSGVSRMGARVDLGTFVPSDVFGVQSEAGMLQDLKLDGSFVARFGGKGRTTPVWLDDADVSATLAP